MKLRMLAALALFSFFAPLSPAWAQKADLPGLEGIWYSCANHKENFDLILEKHKVLFDKQGKFHSAKFRVEGNQIKFAGRTLIMTNGELDEGSTHWVNGSVLLGTHCPGITPQSQTEAQKVAPSSIGGRDPSSESATKRNPLATIVLTWPVASAPPATTINSGTDISKLATEDVVSILKNAASLRVESPSREEKKFRSPDYENEPWGGYQSKELKWCNGESQISSNLRFAWSPARTCVDISGHFRVVNPSSYKRFQALFRSCFLTPQDDIGFTNGCADLGNALDEIHNRQAAIAVLENADGCHNHRDRVGDPDISCDHRLLILYRNDRVAQARVAHKLCDDYKDTTGCYQLRALGEAADMNAAKEAESERKARFESLQRQEEAEAEERREAARERTNALRQLNDQISQSGTAILNTGNEQAAAIRAVAGANAAAQRQAEQQRVAAQQAAARQTQKTSNQNVSSRATSNSTENAGASASDGNGRYVSPLSASCIGQFWDPKHYNWLSFENNCGQAIHLTYAGGISGTEDNLGAGQATNTGWSKAEIAQKGIFNLYVCPAGYNPVDATTHEYVSRTGQTFTCKQQ